jgi:hypothetical protein
MRRILRAVALAALCLGLTLAVQAAVAPAAADDAENDQVTSFLGPSGARWSDPTAWSLGRVPGPGDIVRYLGADTVGVLDVAVNVAALKGAMKIQCGTGTPSVTAVAITTGDITLTGTGQCSIKVVAATGDASAGGTVRAQTADAWTVYLGGAADSGVASPSTVIDTSLTLSLVDAEVRGTVSGGKVTAGDAQGPARCRWVGATVKPGDTKFEWVIANSASVLQSVDASAGGPTVVLGKVSVSAGAVVARARATRIEELLFPATAGPVGMLVMSGTDTGAPAVTIAALKIYAEAGVNSTAPGPRLSILGVTSLHPDKTKKLKLGVSCPSIAIALSGAVKGALDVTLSGDKVAFSTGGAPLSVSAESVNDPASLTVTDNTADGSITVDGTLSATGHTDIKLQSNKAITTTANISYTPTTNEPGRRITLAAPSVRILAAPGVPWRTVVRATGCGQVHAGPIGAAATGTGEVDGVEFVTSGTCNTEESVDNRFRFSHLVTTFGRTNDVVVRAAVATAPATTLQLMEFTRSILELNLGGSLKTGALATSGGPAVDVAIPELNLEPNARLELGSAANAAALAGEEGESLNAGDAVGLFVTSLTTDGSAELVAAANAAARFGDITLVGLLALGLKGPAASPAPTFSVTVNRTVSNTAKGGYTRGVAGADSRAGTVQLALKRVKVGEGSTATEMVIGTTSAASTTPPPELRAEISGAVEMQEYALLRVAQSANFTSTASVQFYGSSGTIEATSELSSPASVVTYAGSGISNGELIVSTPAGAPAGYATSVIMKASVSSAINIKGGSAFTYAGAGQFLEQVTLAGKLYVDHNAPAAPTQVRALTMTGASEAHFYGIHKIAKLVANTGSSVHIHNRMGSAKLNIPQLVAASGVAEVHFTGWREAFPAAPMPVLDLATVTNVNVRLHGTGVLPTYPSPIATTAPVFTVEADPPATTADQRLWGFETLSGQISVPTAIKNVTLSVTSLTVSAITSLDSLVLAGTASSFTMSKNVSLLSSGRNVNLFEGSVAITSQATLALDGEATIIRASSLFQGTGFVSCTQSPTSLPVADVRARFNSTCRPPPPSPVVGCYYTVSAILYNASAPALAEAHGESAAALVASPAGLELAASADSSIPPFVMAAPVNCSALTAATRFNLANQAQETNELIPPGLTWNATGAKFEGTPTQVFPLMTYVVTPVTDRVTGNPFSFSIRIVRSCPAGSYCPDLASAPVPCPAGSFCPADVTAPVPCQSGSSCPASAAAEVDCPAKFVCRIPASIEPCPAGSFCPPRTVEPTPCASGSYCPESSDAERPCPEASFCRDTRTIEPCPAGSYCPVRTVSPLACVAGDFCPQSTGTEHDCPAASFCPNVTAKVQCPASFYCIKRQTAPAECVNTAKNHYYCPAGSSALELCPAHYYCLTPASRTACGTGYVCPASSDRMTMCSEGSFANSTSEVCDECALGTYSPTNASSVCTPCEVGKYADEEGSISCDACPAGRTTNRTGCTSKADCIRAPEPATEPKNLLPIAVACGAGGALLLFGLAIFLCAYSKKRNVDKAWEDRRYDRLVIVNEVS